MFDPTNARAECIRLAHNDKLGKGEYMTSRWDAHGAFISGAAWQHNQTIADNNRLRMLIADVFHGWLPEDAGPGFDWDTWRELAANELGESNGVTGEGS